MLTLWVPATQHCGLEAAGFNFAFFGDCDHHESACKDACADDACQTVEGGAYGKTSNGLRVLPPQVFVGPCPLVVLTAPVPLEEHTAFFTGDPPEIQAIARTWQFAHRTALPARAPDNVA